MLTMYAILLFLGQITCPGSYTLAQMNEIIAANQQQTSLIMADQVQLNVIHQQFDNDANIIATTNSELLH